MKERGKKAVGGMPRKSGRIHRYQPDRRIFMSSDTGYATAAHVAALAWLGPLALVRTRVDGPRCTVPVRALGRNRSPQRRPGVASSTLSVSIIMGHGFCWQWPYFACFTSDA